MHRWGAGRGDRELCAERHGRDQDQAANLVETALLVAAVVSWQRMVDANDAQCKSKMSVVDFTCISSQKNHKMAIVAVPLACLTFVTWRLTNAYQEALRRGTIADAFTLAAKTGTLQVMEGAWGCKRLR